MFHKIISLFKFTVIGSLIVIGVVVLTTTDSHAEAISNYKYRTYKQAKKL